MTLGDFVGMYIGSYEFQGKALPVLDCVFLATMDSTDPVRINPAESTDYGWFPVDDPPPMAFSTMDLALRDLALRSRPARPGSAVPPGVTWPAAAVTPRPSASGPNGRFGGLTWGACSTASFARRGP